MAAGGTEFVGYDALNQPVTFSGMANVQSSANMFWTKQYDALGRVKARIYNEPLTTSAPASAWTWDSDGIGLGNQTIDLNKSRD